MEWNYLSEIDHRIDNRILLWRNTLQLFRHYKNLNFFGPFWKAGFSDFRIETPLYKKDTGEEQNPDIVTSNEEGWSIIEITGNGNSKSSILGSYLEIDSRSLSNFGLHSYGQQPPDILSSRIQYVEDGPYCQMVVWDKFEVHKAEFLKNEALKKALIETVGTDLSRLPEISISFIPESKKYELRRGLVDIIMQIFDPNSNGKTAHQMAIEGLDKLNPYVPNPELEKLKNKISVLMDDLCNRELKDYLEKIDHRYMATDKYKKYPQTLKKVATILHDWAYSEQSELDQWMTELYDDK